MENEKKSSSENEKTEVVIKVYKRRWFVLFIFILYSAVNAFQWIQYPIIANIVTKYYNVSAQTVDWTSIIYMLLYPPLILPASYNVEKKGLRWAALIGGLGTTLGTVVKLFSVQPHLFWVAMLGQVILSAAQTVIANLPPKIASVWFGAQQVSTACALGVFGTQVGLAVGFILPPLVVKNHDSIDEIGKELYVLNWILSGAVIPIGIATIAYFPKQPPLPPSRTQLLERSGKCGVENKGYIGTLKMLFRSNAFIMHMIAYGINIAAYSAIATYINQYVLAYFMNSERDAGLMGLIMTLVGIMGSIICGVILDKTHKYKETAIIVYGISCLGTVLFIYSLELKNKILVYITVTILGMFLTAYGIVGFELCTELTYPASESTAAGIIVAMSQILGVLFTLLTGVLFQKYGSFWSIGSQAAFLFVGTVLTLFTPRKLRRQAASKADAGNGDLELAAALEETIDDRKIYNR